MKSRAASSNKRRESAEFAPSDAAPADETPRAVRALVEDFKRGKLPHALLFFGDDFDALESAALRLCAHILGVPDARAHPDFTPLRPSGKMRQIKIDDKDGNDRNNMRAFLRTLHMTPAAGAHKVGCVYEADCLNGASANAFLKTLEEPPKNTTLILLTTHPRGLLSTIHSRCFHLRIEGALKPLGGERWDAWRADFSRWLGALYGVAKRAPDAEKSPARLVLPLYGLSGRLAALILSESQAQWESRKGTLGEAATDEQKDAFEVGLRRGVCERALREVECAVRDFAAKRLDGDCSERFVRSVEAVERTRGLLALNYAEANAIENFMLQLLRIWSRP